MPYNRLTFTAHAIQRMFERGISRTDVRTVLATMLIIENNPNSTPYPSYLMLGWVNNRPIHVAAADDSVNLKTIIITVYEPDSSQWFLPDFRRRKL